MKRRPLSIPEILRWADCHRETTGRWPIQTSGGIIGAIGETWVNVDHALRVGLRTLPGGSSLALLLGEHRDRRNRLQLPDLTEEQIVAWAVAWHERTGAWPSTASGSIPETGGEKWEAVNRALRDGMRGLPGGSSLARVLATHKGVRNRKLAQPITIEQILAWADAHHERTGQWPRGRSGLIFDAPHETWAAIDVALQQGYRALPGRSSLAWLLAEHRGVGDYYTLAPLSVPQILAWADAFFERHGKWPQKASGAIDGVEGETWQRIDKALYRGARTLPGGSSLSRLLFEARGVRKGTHLPPLKRKDILAWADAHFRDTGDWPTSASGPIPGSVGETWATVDEALRTENRGLKGKSSLARFLAKHRGKLLSVDRPALSIKSILTWADAHHQRTGKWPVQKSGAIVDAPGETWGGVDQSLRDGNRGLQPGSSLARVLERKRGVVNRRARPNLTIAQIRNWAEAHRHGTGQWPTARSGPIANARNETWAGVDSALRRGKRGFQPGSSLARLLATFTGDAEDEPR